MDAGNEQTLVAFARDRVLATLRARRERDGVLSGRLVREAAAELGCSTRSVWRWLADGAPSSADSRRMVDEELYAAYVRWHGNVAAARRELVAAGRAMPSLRTLERAFIRELRPAERAAARIGEAGLRAHGLYLQWEADRRNEVWQGDHKQLDVLVVPPRARRPQRPWSTIFIDSYSRAILGWAISLRPSQAEVLAALREGMLFDAGGVLGGVPERLRIDHGLEFCAQAVRTVALALGIEFSLATEYTPSEKGKVERLHLTCVQTLLCGLPCYTGGRRGADRRLSDGEPPLTLERFVELFAAWVVDYNARAHSELGGRGPIDVFTGDATALRSISAEQARSLLTARKTTRVHRQGVSHQRKRFVAAELHDLVGEEVQIAFTPHDDREIEIYRNGEWVCTAFPQDALSAEQQQRIIAERRAYASEVRRRQRHAIRQGRSRLAPMTATSPTPTDATVLDGKALSSRSPRREAALRSEARIDLLVPSGPPRAIR